MIRYEPDLAAHPAPRRSVAVALGLAALAFALVAALAQVAETPAGGTTPFLARLNPGKIGVLRAQEFDAELRPRGNPLVAALAAAPVMPLAAEPFVGAASSGFRMKGSTGTAHDAALLREGLRRNPRFREARLLLLRHAIGTGNLPEAIDQLGTLRRLSSEIVGQMLLGIGAALNSPRQVDDAIAAMRPHPELYPDFMRGFTAAQKPPALVTRLVMQLPPSALADTTVRERAISEMVRVAAFAQARQLWGARYAGNGQGLVHSPDFSDAAAPPPFNWDLNETDTGVAERITGQKGVSLAYYGRISGPLVNQLLTLAPGRYTASVTYRNATGVPGVIALQVFCGIGQLVQIPLSGKLGEERTDRLAFTVPTAGCGGQYLSLVGLPQEERQPLETVVTAVTVTAANVNGGARP